jgi:hypothetical protein
MRVSSAGAPSTGPALRSPSPVTGGQLLALALSLRARGLRGLDVLRRSTDRAPPGWHRPQGVVPFHPGARPPRGGRAFRFLRRAP